MSAVLIGFMGAGKSTVGKLLAQKLGWEFVDTDVIIERNEGRSISQIFEEKNGEERFRNLETAILKTFSGRENILLSTGGGMILRAENIVLMMTIGPIIYLSADAETIYERIKHETHRPLLKVADPKAEIGIRLKTRKPIYEGVADIIIETAKYTPQEICEEIARELAAR